MSAQIETCSICGKEVSELARAGSLRVGLFPQCARCLSIYFEFRQEERREERRLKIEAQLLKLVELIDAKVPRMNRPQRKRTVFRGMVMRKAA